MWDLFTGCFKDKPSPRTIAHAIVNAPFKINIKQYAGFDDVLEEVIAHSLDCESRIKALGLLF